MTRTYTPPPGSVPHNAVAWLQANAPSRDVSTRELALAIGSNPDSISGCLGKALKHGWVVRRYRGPGYCSFWRLGPAAATALPSAKPAQAFKPMRPPGHYTEDMRRNNWPPGYRPHFELQRAQGSRYLRIVETGRASA